MNLTLEISFNVREEKLQDVLTKCDDVLKHQGLK